MVRIEEDSFPRGGKKIPAGVKRKNVNDTLFGNEAPKKHKRNKVADINIEDTTLASLNKQGILSISTLQEGMTVLSCIRKITKHALDVELPGLVNGRVTIDAISDTLNVSLKHALKSSDTSSVSDMLKNIFNVGQYVPFKVRSIENKDDKTIILGSISPTEVNSGRTHNSIRQGELLWAAVISELDHGYQLDCGIANCRIFLPIQNVEETKKLNTGQPIWCKVHKVDTQSAASTLRVGAKQQHISSAFTDESIALNLILPGTKVEVFVEKVLKHGIYCKFLDNFVGFIHESQLNPPMQKLSTIKEARTMPAYVLYVEETTRITHLSLRGLNSEFEQTYARGEKVSALVIGKNPHGLYFKLNQNDRGWVSNRRLLNALGKNSKNINLIQEKYSTGTKHQCVILNYNHMDRVYICGIEKELLKEKYFDYKDFTVGELVEGVVQEIKPNGIIVGVGQAQGFIPNIHLTDSPYSENLKKKFIVGKKIRVRVFLSNENSVIFTLKSKFVKDENCLSSIENVKLNQIYPALVLRSKPFGLVLLFYNNVEGFVPMKELSFKVTQEYRDNPSSYFYSGEVINVRILQAKSDKVIASLILDGPTTKINEIGINVKAVVTKVQENGLTVFVPTKSIEGFVPVQHLSIDKSLCQAMLETFKKNDRISDLLIIKSDEFGTVLSRREAIGYERFYMRVPKFQNIRKGAILRCSVESIESNGIFVSSPIKNFNKKIFVKRKLISSDRNIPQFEIQQSVIGKVLEINQAKETIVLSLRPEIVFDKNIQNAVSLFSEYLADEEYLRKFGSKNGWPLNQYKVADTVLCTVKQISPDGCLVELPNGCQGLVTSTLCGAVKKGQKVEGIVLGHNYKRQYVEICLKHTIINRINPSQDGSLPENELHFTAHKLLTREQYVLTFLRRNGNRQLVYIPLRLCENDSSDSLKSFYEADTFKIEICGKFHEKLIGFHRTLKNSLDHKFMLKNKESPQLDNTISSIEDISETAFGIVKSEQRSEPEEESDMEIIEEPLKEENEYESVEDVTEINDQSLTDTIDDSGVYSRDNNCDLSKKMSTNHSAKNSVNEGEGNGTGEITDKEECDEEDYSENKQDNKQDTHYKEKDQINCPQPILPSISNFFSAQIHKKLDESSSEDEMKEVEIKKKKKKLTPAEKSQQVKLEEERISKIERKLADSREQPQSAEHFESILLTEPNSSVLWIKYISYYLALAEFDKARAIGKKALDTIDMTMEEEKLNVWITLLSIENLYGTKESFEHLFEDAIKCNDAFPVYMKVIDMLYESGKHVELEEKIKKVRSKFRLNPEMWVHIAKVYYLLGKLEDARSTKNACLKSITSAKQQYNLIIKFAILEFSHGDMDVGSTIFENVIDTYPNKVNAWMVYIEQLISKKKFTEARSLLERSITMKLPLKAARVLYHKYRLFEEKHGTKESLELFKIKASKALQEKVEAVV